MERFIEILNASLIAAALSTACAGGLCACSGCGGPSGAGSIDMSQAKETAASRGIPERKVASTAPQKAAGKPRGPRPTQAKPKGKR